MAGVEALVLGFGDIGARAVGAVGGKGVNLAWMAQAGLPVPPGFCVTTAAFWRFVGREVEPLYAALDALDPGDALDRKRHPPLVLMSDGETPTVGVRGDLPAGAIGGIGASAGMIEGLARVVLDPALEVLYAGEILIAPFTDPGWTPLFTHAAGLVTEVGGLMTHGSVIARELGIPAVVGAAGVTTRINTGDRVRVDGNRGYVQVIARRRPDTQPANEPQPRPAVWQPTSDSGH